MVTRSLAPVAWLCAPLLLGCGDKPAPSEAEPPSEAASTESATTTAAPAAPPPTPRGFGDPTAPRDVVSPPADARRGSGLSWIVTRAGRGTSRPRATDTVTVHYAGWTADGRRFARTFGTKKPYTSRLDKVIAGWRSGIMLMVEGERRRFWIPARLAYGDKPKSAKLPAGDLVFELELVSIERQRNKPPADAKRTRSGLSYKVLRPGKGARPRLNDSVIVHYSGWNAAWRLFESTLPTNRPYRTPVSRVIKGWTEGLQLMSPGEKTRFWLPAKLAYGDTPANPLRPAGDLVYDIELLRVIATPAGEGRASTRRRSEVTPPR